MPRITIVNQPITLPATEQTILDAALAAHVPYPHGCRSGSCGTCKARLLEGDVQMQSFDPGALSEAEAAEGLILACRARPCSDVVIECLGEWHDPLPPVRRLAARVVALDRVARAVSRLRVAVEGQGLVFLAGQYAELSFDGGPARAYSMANPPDDPVLEFHVRHFGGVASSYVAERLRIGARVKLCAPYGTAYLRQPSRPIVAVAGSTGLAPIRSIVFCALARGHAQPIHVLFGVRDEPDLYGVDELRFQAREHPDFRITPVLSQPEAATGRATGLVHEALARAHASLAGCDIYLAGPPPMVEAARATALALGAEPQAIFADAFVPTYGAPLGRPGWLRSLLGAGRRIDR
jgi:CDP-4-dehydro-6-deoxyglucose reductase/ferredoxin-NAD(P)+ reductase (naphthalene dioxygenase ferredoxin-specific)